VRIVDWAEMDGRGATCFVFRGGNFGSSVCVFVTDFPPGQGPVLHRHPYEETFVVHEGVATFTAGDETIEATVGQVVVVPAGTDHRYVNATQERLRVMSVHPRPVVEQEDLEPRGG
jgi:quercetin dioxygenase-like cupin family protein